MTNYELFENLINAKNKGNEIDFNFYAIHLAGAFKENPYKKDSKEFGIASLLYGDYLGLTSRRIGDKAEKKNIIARINILLSINSNNPFKKEEKEQLKQKQNKESKKNEEVEITKEEVKEDVQYLLFCMANAYNKKDESSYEMYVSHLLDINAENPFKLGTDEYELFSTMQACWTKTPPNKRKSYVVGKQLCDLINNTEVEPEKPKETVLGVVPEEKKSWFKFLFPWKKEGESDDSTGID